MPPSLPQEERHKGVSLKQFHTRTVWSFLVQCFYPRRCVVCDGAFFLSECFRIHPDCRKKLEPVDQPFCFGCGKPLSDPAAEYCSDCKRRRRSFKRNVAAFVYNEAARESIVRFKYHGRQAYAKTYAEEIWALRKEEILSFKADALIPVPIHRDRLLKRGYNQAELLAHELSKLSGIPLRGDLLFRTKKTRAQKALGPKARIRNLADAFAVSASVKGIQTVLLVDDIFTTGSTMEACTRLLLAAGVRAVYGVTLCITVNEQ